LLSTAASGSAPTTCVREIFPNEGQKRVGSRKTLWEAKQGSGAGRLVKELKLLGTFFSSKKERRPHTGHVELVKKGKGLSESQI